jgi:hypothetical protein
VNYSFKMNDINKKLTPDPNSIRWVLSIQITL